MHASSLSMRTKVPLYTIHCITLDHVLYSFINYSSQFKTLVRKSGQPILSQTMNNVIYKRFIVVFPFWSVHYQRFRGILLSSFPGTLYSYLFHAGTEKLIVYVYIHSYEVTLFSVAIAICIETMKILCAWTGKLLTSECFALRMTSTSS